jgi:hypothetical protein
MSPLHRVEVFYGDCSPSAAHVYARLPGLSHEDGWTLSGTVRGPECALSRTLPATVRMADMGPGEGLLAHAVLPDPCSWSPELPGLYRVAIELHRHGDDVDAAQRVLGIRMLGPRGRSLYLDGLRWVPRGISRGAAEPCELAAWREAAAMMIVAEAEADDALCEAASHQGVLLAVRLSGDSDACLRRLAHLARFAATAVAIVERRDVDGAALRRVAPNILVAALVPANVAVEVPAWAHLAVCEVADPAAFGQRTADLACPVIAVRSLEAVLPLAEARAACDDLQRDLAPHGDFAGYAV